MLMNNYSLMFSFKILLAMGLLFSTLANVYAADKALLDILLENKVITQAQYESLIEKESLTKDDLFVVAPAENMPAEIPTKSHSKTSPGKSYDVNEVDIVLDTDAYIKIAVADAVAAKIDEDFPVASSYTNKGFRLESRDGNWQTNLQWRAQMRYTNPFSGDPRQLDDFAAEDSSNFESRRLRMKIGGHGYQPWLKYYFEVDLQPSRSAGSSAASSSARVIDWRIDIAKWAAGGLRFGQWKIDMNRERVDSSGRQQFVERSIVNRIFTIDRQIGVQWRGHAFKGTAADLRYYLGVFNGEGRGVRNANEDMMYAGRVQWNFMGRDLPLRQGDVEFTEKPTGSLVFAGMTTKGPCTRWSSSGCGNLDGFTSSSVAGVDQFKVEQAVQEFAFKYRGFSIQQEWHRKFIDDRIAGSRNDLTGFYLQSGYFFNNLVSSVPAPLEFAIRYGYVEEPNEDDQTFYNEREEYTIGANWYFAGHSNKLTLDYSFLTVDDDFLNADDNSNRVRLQWDVSF
jgi:phosphate-selective porin OprO/OprP